VTPGLRQIAIASLAALVTVAPIGIGRAEETYFGLPFPAKIAGATRAPGVTDFDAALPGGGYGAIYRHPDLQIDVHITNDGESSTPDDFESAVLKNHLEDIKTWAFKKQGGAGNAKVEFVRDFVIADQAGRARLRCSQFVYSRIIRGKDDVLDNFECFAGWHNKLVEFTLYHRHGPGSEAAARRFVEAWFPILWP
jgi:hypothetical protein